MARTPIRGRPSLRLAWGGPAAPLTPRGRGLPASGSEQLFLRDGENLETVHRLPEAGGDFGQNLWLVEVGGRGNDCFGHLQGLLRLEDARADEDSIHPKLHHQ